ncbi:MAG: DUF58 domain-containing protein [Ruminococcus sp.]|nr:DUF58 domain-containing protein [Ruminococcus sp.]
MRVTVIIGRVLNFLAAVALCTVFALYMSARIGWFLVTAFIAAPVISVCIALLFRTRIYARCGAGSALLSKGESCTVDISIVNDCFLPSPPVIVEIYDSPQVRCGCRQFSVSVMPYSSESVNAEFTAKFCGYSSVGVSRIRITDYFGLISIEPSGIDLDGLAEKIAVLPDIADIPENDGITRKIREMAASADDSEDTAESGMNVFGGYPGYDIREYVPGDPLKRINWKQSAKKGKLLVRLDDEAVCTSLTVVLDSVFDMPEMNKRALLTEKEFEEYTYEDIEPLIAQTAVERSLGVLSMLLGGGYSLSFMMCGKNGWEAYSIPDQGALSELRTELAKYSFQKASDMSRFPAEELSLQKGSVSVFCTPFIDRELAAACSQYSGNDSKGALNTAVYAVCGSGSVGEVNDENA